VSGGFLRGPRAAVTAVAVMLFASTGAAAVPAAAQSNTLVLAVVAPFTGDEAAEGQNAKEGAEAAAAQINSAGGIGGKQVQLQYEDDRGDPKEAANIAQKLVGQKSRIFAVIGHTDSSPTLAALPIYSQAGMPVLNNSSSNPKITQLGYQNFIRMVQPDDNQAKQMVAFAVNNLKKSNIGIFFGNSDYGRGVRDYQVPIIQQLGVQQADEESFTPNQDKDFSSQLTKMVSTSPDAVMLNTVYTEGGLVLRQAQTAGLTDVVWIGPDSNLYDDYINLSGGAAEGTYVLAAFDPFASSPKTVALVQQFQSQYKTLPSEVAVFTYDIVFLVQSAVGQGASQDTLISTIKGMTFDGAGGTYQWDSKGDVGGKPLAVIQVQDGKFASTGQTVDLTGLSS